MAQVLDDLKTLDDVQLIVEVRMKENAGLIAIHGALLDSPSD
jgi:hypothetical protein